MSHFALRVHLKDSMLSVLFKMQVSYSIIYKLDERRKSTVGHIWGAARRV